MTSSSTIRPNKTEARKLQREKKRTAHLENINKDLNLPSESKISERKDRRVQKNNVLGFQYSMALKTREKVRTFIVRDEVNLNLTNFFTVFTSQRINELQLYISLELFDNEDELRAIKLELKGLIQNKLDMYDLCDTSSDDGKKLTVSKVTAKKSMEEKQPSPKIKNRLPGVLERWNEDLSEHEAQIAEMSTEEEELSEEERDEREDQQEQEDHEEQEEQEELEKPEENSEPIQQRDEAIDEQNDEASEEEEEEILKSDLESLLNTSDSEAEGEIVVNNRGLDTSTSSRNSGGSKRSNHLFSYPDTQFTATEETILSPILNKKINDVPITRQFVHGKSCSSKDVPTGDPKTKQSSKSVTRSSQLTVPLQKATQPLATNGSKLNKASKRVIEDNTEEENEYSWDKDKRKKTKRTKHT